MIRTPAGRAAGTTVAALIYLHLRAAEECRLKAAGGVSRCHAARRFAGAAARRRLGRIFTSQVTAIWARELAVELGASRAVAKGKVSHGIDCAAQRNLCDRPWQARLKYSRVLGPDESKSASARLTIPACPPPLSLSPLLPFVALADTDNVAQ